MTTLTLNEIRTRAGAFAKDFVDATRENAESQIFWHEFFQVFGLPKRRVISFEHNVQKLGNKAGALMRFGRAHCWSSKSRAAKTWTPLLPRATITFTA